MPTAFALRAQIEAALAERIPSALTPAPRMVRPVLATGIGAVDELLKGGLPGGALTEMVGAECSGRTALALAFAAQVTRSEKVCAWVDVSDALSPESATAAGVDLARLLWLRCGVAPTGIAPSALPAKADLEGGFSVPKKYFVAKPAIKGLHGGGMGGHPRGEARGMDDAVSGLLRQEVSTPPYAPRCAEPMRRQSQSRETVERVGFAAARSVASVPGRPWSRIEQALRATDLLLQGGGFAAIVLDMGGLAPEHVSRIPLATWFRYRAGAERTQACVLLLTQHACSKSSAGLVLRLASADAPMQEGTVLEGMACRVEVARQRFAVNAEKVVSIRKPPQSLGVAIWRSRTAWGGRR